MNTQNECEALYEALRAKGKKRPGVEITFRPFVTPSIKLEWEDTNDKWQFRWPESLSEAFALIAAMPEIEEARRLEFFVALDSVIELGRRNEIDVAFLNPLTDLMKRLSKNALEDHS